MSASAKKSLAPRPYVIINCAISVDGKLALSTRKQTPISSHDDLRRVHRLRARSDAVLVGINTILSDNPSLCVKQRFVPNLRHQPLRIVLDSRCRVPRNAKILDGTAPTLIVVTQGYKKKLPNCEVIECGTKRVALRKLMTILYRKKIRRLMVEGGGTVIGAFLKERLVDELNIYIGNMVIGSPAPSLVEGWCATEMKEIIALRLVRVLKLNNGIVLNYRLKAQNN